MTGARLKRQKTDDNIKIGKKVNTVRAKPSKKCGSCGQFLDKVTIYNGHPNDSVEEFIALTDPKLQLVTERESTDNGSDIQESRPSFKITMFSVYCEKGHLCHFDIGLIEANVPLMFSGYIKHVIDENCTTADGVPSFNMGPINEWWVTGFDGGSKALVGFSTEYAEYFLVEPAIEYQPFWEEVQEKISLSKRVIEYLSEEAWREPNYEDLIRFVRTFLPNAEDSLQRNAQFLCNQVRSLDLNDDDEEMPLIDMPCMKTLMDITGVVLNDNQPVRQLTTTSRRKKKSEELWTKAISTTPFVESFYQNCFDAKLDDVTAKFSGLRKKRCGACEGCLTNDCGKCSNCRDMKKFQGLGKSKQACKLRACKNMALQDVESDDSGAEDSNFEMETKKPVGKICAPKIYHDSVIFPKDHLVVHKQRKFYSRVTVGDMSVKLGDYVLLNSVKETTCVGKITFICEDMKNEKLCHVRLFVKGVDTILGSTADPQELFAIDHCEEVLLGSILKVLEVEYRAVSSIWLKSRENAASPTKISNENFFYTYRYQTEPSRFTPYIQKPSQNNVVNDCDSCIRIDDIIKRETVVYENGTVKWKDESYTIGSCVFLKPETCDLDLPKMDHDSSKHSLVAGKVEAIYTEYYRKANDNASDVPQPACFIIARVEDIKDDNMKSFKARIFYRPENVRKPIEARYRKPLAYIYWTDKIITTTWNQVMGKCHILYGGHLEDPIKWSTQGPHRFYFDESYDVKKFSFSEVSNTAMKMGLTGKGRGKGKSKQAATANVKNTAPEWPQVQNPMKIFEVFSGCGGFCQGLSQSGVGVTKWAIEKDEKAAESFRLNYPKCKVFTNDSNDLLHTIINKNESAVKMGLPTHGNVDLLVCSPPCQGLSVSNPFKATEYTVFKKSLVPTCLSYCDYYRPKYFVFDNVRKFVRFKRGFVLKLMLRCLLAMGYQVTFGLVQAAHYGVPQTRRRFVIMAATPDCVLPLFPEPQHSFRHGRLSFEVDGTRFSVGSRWAGAMPYRAITIRDAISDLPEIANGFNQPALAYNSEPYTHYQQIMRGGSDYVAVVVYDHVCKNLEPLAEARMAEIPRYPGADWRDLPNIEVILKNGSKTEILKYQYRTKDQPKNEPPRGVCQCVEGKPCNLMDRQPNTLIPWCLAHTADRHGHWKGLYGRLEYEGFFNTMTTNPEPIGKQGKVLHPEQNRVVSVRECARSQGFVDNFKFTGDISDKYRQIGNAMPPPLACAIGKEIAKAFIASHM